MTCAVCVTTSVGDILRRYHLFRTLICSSDRDHKTQRSAVKKAWTDDATVQHVVFCWRCFKKHGSEAQMSEFVKCQLPRLGSPHFSSRPLPLAPHVGRCDNSPGLLFTLLPLLFCNFIHSRLCDFLPWLRNSSGVFDYPASPFSTYTPSCSLPLCQILLTHMADWTFFFASRLCLPIICLVCTADRHSCLNFELPS